MPGRVLVCGAWVPLAQAEALVMVPLNHPGHADQSSHGRKGRKAAEAPPEPTGRGGVEALPRMKKPPTVRVAAQGANPDYGSTSGAYGEHPTYRDAGKAGKLYTPDMGPLPAGAFEENCTNCVQAFEMRMRGFDVKAAPLDVLDRHGYAAGRTYRETDDQIASSYSLPDGSPHGRSFAGQKWRSFKEIDAEVADTWPEGGRGYMTVGKHVFAVVKVRGKAKYIEPQSDVSPTREVTAQYRRKYRSPAWGWNGSPEEAKIVRLDDLVPADGIMSAVVAA